MVDGPRSWLPKNTASSTQKRVIRSVGYYHNLTTKPMSQYRQDIIMLTNQTDHHVVEKNQMPNTSPRQLAVEAKR